MNDDEILDKMIEALATISEGCRMNSDDKGVCCKDCKLARIVFNDDIGFMTYCDFFFGDTIPADDWKDILQKLRNEK